MAPWTKLLEVMGISWRERRQKRRHAYQCGSVSPEYGKAWDVAPTSEMAILLGDIRAAQVVLADSGSPSGRVPHLESHCARVSIDGRPGLWVQPFPEPIVAGNPVDVEEQSFLRTLAFCHDFRESATFRRQPKMQGAKTALDKVSGAEPLPRCLS
uniref:Uncharacterized protein n=1 Tax=Trichuris muris TaxID=70415 RepID=A0A5S6QRT2_TRIMR